MKIKPQLLLIVLLITAGVSFFFAMQQRKKYEIVLSEYLKQKELLEQNSQIASEQTKIAQSILEKLEHKIAYSDSLKVQLINCKQ